MATSEVMKKVDQMNVIQYDDKIFYVDSADGRILYKVLVMDDERNTLYCTCPDFTKNIKTNPEFQCDHIAAVRSGVNRTELAGGRKRPRLAEDFIKRIDGKDFVLYSGLLDLAHQGGLMRLEVELVQFPSKENDNTAICRATAVSRTGEVFVDYGDANSTNCNPKVAKHLIRMASTRAKGRALRDYTNIGITCLEELGDVNEVIEDHHTAVRKTVYERPKSEAVFAHEPEAEHRQPRPETNGSLPSMSDAQRRAILNLSKRRGIDDGKVHQMAQEHFGAGFDDLSIRDASAFIRLLQQTS